VGVCGEWGCHRASCEAVMGRGPWALPGWGGGRSVGEGRCPTAAGRLVNLQNSRRGRRPARLGGALAQQKWKECSAEMYINGWKGGGGGAQGMVEIQFNGVIDRKGLWSGGPCRGSGEQAGGSRAQRASKRQGGESERHMGTYHGNGMDSRGEWGIHRGGQGRVNQEHARALQAVGAAGTVQRGAAYGQGGAAHTRGLGQISAESRREWFACASAYRPGTQHWGL
jgi:hypothetical protein